MHTPDIYRPVDHPLCFENHFEYAYYPLVDDETDNILLYLEPAITAIIKCIESAGNVLVHCVQGVSRSVAFVTGFVMKRQRIAFTDAYRAVLLAYPEGNMAENFKDQLTAYGALFQWDMNLNTQAHRIYRAKNRFTFSEGQAVDDVPQFRYTCRKCRESLFLDTQCVSDASNNLRIECMRWMEAQVDAGTAGSVLCPRCGTKLGQFNWSGLAGDYEMPGFMITASKVDRMPLSCSFKGEPFPQTRY